MIDEDSNIIQKVILGALPIVLIIAFFIIRYKVILPQIKYNNIEKFYSGSLKDKSSDNDYEFQYVNVEDIIDRIFFDYKTKLIYYKKDAYKHINKKEVSSLFKNYDEFDEFVEKNKEKIFSSKIVKYSSNGSSFKVLDQNNYKYSFQYTNPADYTVNIELFK